MDSSSTKTFPLLRKAPLLIIQESKEAVVASTVASRNNAFKRLGLTDAVFLEAVPAKENIVIE